MNPRVAVIVVACIVFALLSQIPVPQNILGSTIHPNVNHLRLRKQPPRNQKELEKPSKVDYSIVNRDVALEVLPSPENGSAVAGSEDWKHVRKVANPKEEGYVAERFTEEVEPEKIPLASVVAMWVHEKTVGMVKVPELGMIAIFASILGLFRSRYRLSREFKKWLFQPKGQSDINSVPVTPRPTPSIDVPVPSRVSVIATPGRRHVYGSAGGRAWSMPRKVS